MHTRFWSVCPAGSSLWGGRPRASRKTYRGPGGRGDLGAGFLGSSLQEGHQPVERGPEPAGQFWGWRGPRAPAPPRSSFLPCECDGDACAASPRLQAAPARRPGALKPLPSSPDSGLRLPRAWSWGGVSPRPSLCSGGTGGQGARSAGRRGPGGRGGVRGRGAPGRWRRR